MKRTVIIIGIIIIIGMIYFAGAKEGFQQAVLMTGINIIATIYEVSTFIIKINAPPGTVIKNTSTNTVVWSKGDPPVSSTEINKYLIILPEGGRTTSDQLPSVFSNIESMIKKDITYPDIQISIQLSTSEEYPSKIMYYPSNSTDNSVTDNSVPSSFPVTATGFNIIISQADLITLLNSPNAINTTVIDVATNQQVDITKLTSDTNLRKYFIPAPQEASDLVIADLNTFNQILNQLQQTIGRIISKNIPVSIQTSDGEYPPLSVGGSAEDKPIIVTPTDNSVPSSFPVTATGFNLIISSLDLNSSSTKMGRIFTTVIDVATNQQVDITKSTTDTNIRKYFIPAPQESSDLVISDLNKFNETLNEIKQLFSVTLSKNIPVSIQTSDGEYPPLALPTNGGSEQYNPIDCQMGQLLRSIKNNLTKMV